MRIGDRLLEVNGVSVTGKSQPEVATMLREISVGQEAKIIVSRQLAVEKEDAKERSKSASPKLPRQLVSVITADKLLSEWILSIHLIN